MNEIVSVLKTFLAYLRKPDLYPELDRKIVKNTINRGNAFKRKEKTKLWASSKAISQKEAVSMLFGYEIVTFRNRYREILEKAERREQKCAVKIGGSGALELIYYTYEIINAQLAIGTGIAYGWSSLVALLSLKKRDGIRDSLDTPYLAQDGDQYVVCVVPENLKRFWKLFRFADEDLYLKFLQPILLLVSFTMIQIKAMMEECGLIINFIIT